MKKHCVSLLFVFVGISTFLIGQAAPQCGSMLWVDGDGKVTTEAKVGIGTTEPGALLDVQGGLYCKGGSGDITGNGNIDCEDTGKIFNYLISGPDMNVEEFARADVNGDGKVTRDDFLMIWELQGKMPGTPEHHEAKEELIKKIGNLYGAIDETTFLVDGSLEISEYVKLNIYQSAPFECERFKVGTIALTGGFRTCVCNGFNWVFTSDGLTECEW